MAEYRVVMVHGLNLFSRIYFLKWTAVTSFCIIAATSVAPLQKKIFYRNLILEKLTKISEEWRISLADFRLERELYQDAVESFLTHIRELSRLGSPCV